MSEIVGEMVISGVAKQIEKSPIARSIFLLIFYLISGVFAGILIYFVPSTFFYLVIGLLIILLINLIRVLFKRYSGKIYFFHQAVALGAFITSVLITTNLISMPFLDFLWFLAWYMTLKDLYNLLWFLWLIDLIMVCFVDFLRFIKRG